jgi:hypothetical protein
MSAADKAPVHIVTVRLTTDANSGLTRVSLADGERISHYDDSEGASSGVCIALEATSRAVARHAINVEHGLFLRVDLERDGVLTRPDLGGYVEWALKDSRELRHALKRLADAAEAAVAGAPRPPDDFDAALAEARQLLKGEAP